MPRRTTLRCGEANVEMIEHVMAALAGLQVDNCECWVDQPEMPAATALACRSSRLCGRRASSRKTPCGVGRSSVARFRLGNPEELDRGTALPFGPNDPEIRSRFRQRQSDRAAVAGSVAFAAALPREPGPQPDLHAGDGGRGHEGARIGAAGNLRRTCWCSGSRGPIGNQLRFPDECVRHKLADMVGDLALAGCDLVGRFGRLSERAPP